MLRDLLASLALLLSLLIVPTLAADRTEQGVHSANRLVVIYAANTPHEERLREMVTWLQAEDDEQVRKVVSRIENDLAEFPPGRQERNGCPEHRLSARQI